MNRADCTVTYEKEHRRLVYQGSEVNEQHWDSQWGELVTPEAIRRADHFVVGETRKALAPGSKVLDAGCGLSHTVWGLQEAGFEAHGVDYAAETVRTVNRLAPELNIRTADVRELPFEDGYFDGVWSLGVIEHFPEGYEAIIREMWRVLRPGGFAFVTVPSMSPLRRAKAAVGAYPAFAGDMSDFYQFVLDPRDIVRRFTADGWVYEGGKPRGGFKGLKDESGALLPFLQKVYDHPSKLARYGRGALNRLLAPVSFHTKFYRFSKPI